MNMKKNKSVFDKIDKYLRKKDHQLCMSLFMNNYNGNDIYVRVDFVPKLSCYKLVWVDLNFFDEKHMEDYINIQIITKILSMKLLELMQNIKMDSSYSFNERFIGDRVEILSYFQDTVKEFVFDRFVPLEWKFLIDPLAIIFTYLPRSMEVFLNEMFANFDGLTHNYMFRKPIRFDIFKDDLKELFSTSAITMGNKYYECGAVSFLEKIDNQYIAIVDERRPFLITIDDLGDGVYRFYCSCKIDNFCRHLYAVIMAIRNNKFKKFYKVKYTGKEETMLEMVTIRNYYLCFGVDEDNLLVVTGKDMVSKFPILHNGKRVFEVIEDDDNLSLSNIISTYDLK